jgi:hypothetical protein
VPTQGDAVLDTMLRDQLVYLLGDGAKEHVDRRLMVTDQLRRLADANLSWEDGNTWVVPAHDQHELHVKLTEIASRMDDAYDTVCRHYEEASRRYMEASEKARDLEQSLESLEAERDELGINCGYQDRVIQMYNGLVFMDFDRAYLEEHEYGRYERLDPALLPNLYIAYDPNRAEESGKAHRKVKKLFEEKKPDVIAAMSEFAELAQKGRDALVAGRKEELPALIDANFDLRNKIFNVSEENRRMVQVARNAGSSAKFAGSGGAIVGTYTDEEQFTRLSVALREIGCRTLKPNIAVSDEVEMSEDGVWRNS